MGPPTGGNNQRQDIKSKKGSEVKPFQHFFRRYESARGRILAGGTFKHHCYPPERKEIGEKSQLFHLILSLANKRGLPLSDTLVRRLPIGQRASRGVVFTEYDYAGGRRG